MTSPNVYQSKMPDAEPIQIFVRGYAIGAPESGKRKPTLLPNRPRLGPSEWTVIFDTETTTDAAQKFRIGSYQVRKSEKLFEEGIFYDGGAITTSEFILLQSHSINHGLRLRSQAEFLDEVFLAIGYWLRATVVGFNLPFDISRIAIDHGPARRSMRGGFSFKLSESSREPRLQVKHLSARSALLRFTHPGKQLVSRGSRRRGIPVQPRRGYFVDVKTLAAALTSKSHTLAGLTSYLGTKTQKVNSDDHGEALTSDYLRYARADVQATWECYLVLLAKYEGHRLDLTPAHLIKSEAGIGKAYLKQMGIRPWREVQPDFSSAEIGKIVSCYFGGRSEVKIRREIKEVEYCDFLSMYPTVCTLMRLWQFVISEGMVQHDSTKTVRDFVTSVDLKELQQIETWRMLRTIVRVQADADIFPIRGRYGHEAQKTIGLNYLTSDTPLWFTLADCIASKLLTGKSPNIVEALTFAPGKLQAGLKTVKVGGRNGTVIDPVEGDFYCTLIDQRTVLKDRLKGANGKERETLESEQLAIKILANSTSYGIFIEVNVEDLNEAQDLVCHGYDAREFPVRRTKVEKPGKYFHPLLAVLITGAARLMLAITERLATDRGLEWVFCDTDSMALARPSGMETPEFRQHAGEVRMWFTSLNPYQAKGDLLKQEEANFAVTSTRERQPLYCLAISAKRYALFNVGVDGRPQIRKASAHGLGHLMAPYQDGEGPSDIPAPPLPLSEIGVDRWQYDLWYRIVHAAQVGTPDQPRLDLHPSFEQAAMSRYAATTPDLLSWFKQHNADRHYTDQVRPFGFLSGLHARPGAHSKVTGVADEAPRRRAWRPTAPFSRDPSVAAGQAFDRGTGQSVPLAALQTYQNAIAQYHLHPEAKFLRGNYTDRGPTQRRHVLVTAVAHIGKEADRLEEQMFLGSRADAEVEYGADGKLCPDECMAISSGVRLFGQANVARAARMSLRDVSAAAHRPEMVRPDHAHRLKHALARLTVERDGRVTTSLSWEAARPGTDGNNGDHEPQRD